MNPELARCDVTMIYAACCQVLFDYEEMHVVYFTFRHVESFTTTQLVFYSPWISNKGAWKLHFETLRW